MVEKEGKTSQSPFAQSDRPSSDLPTHLNLRRTSGSADPSHKVLQTLVSRIKPFTTFIRAQGEPHRPTLLVSRALLLHPNYPIRRLAHPSAQPTPTPDATIPTGLRSPILDHHPLLNRQTGAQPRPTVPIPVRSLHSLLLCPAVVLTLQQKHIPNGLQSTCLKVQILVCLRCPRLLFLPLARACSVLIRVHSHA